MVFHQAVIFAQRGIIRMRKRLLHRLADLFGYILSHPLPGHSLLTPAILMGTHSIVRLPVILPLDSSLATPPSRAYTVPRRTGIWLLAKGVLLYGTGTQTRVTIQAGRGRPRQSAWPARNRNHANRLA